MTSPAQLHSLQANHHVFINLHTSRVCWQDLGTSQCIHVNTHITDALHAIVLVAIDLLPP
jgi:hypothetical protein